MTLQTTVGSSNEFFDIYIQPHEMRWSLYMMKEIYVWNPIGTNWTEWQYEVPLPAADSPQSRRFGVEGITESLAVGSVFKI